MNNIGNNPAKKFYFLDYFYIILKVIEDSPVLSSNQYDFLLQQFVEMKDYLKLGESKYKKLTVDDADFPSPNQLSRIDYTFRQVILESLEYSLIQEVAHSFLELTFTGRQLLMTYKKYGSEVFNLKLLAIMEKTYGAFSYLVNFLYNANTLDGCLIFPHYSPRLLGMPKDTMKTTGDVVVYTEKLASYISKDVRRFVKRNVELEESNKELLEQFYDSNLLERDGKSFFNPINYNAIIRRCKKHWETYLLKNIYGYRFSWTAFEIWSYRAKQLEIVHVTEFYPNQSGKVIFPISVISQENKSEDFKIGYEFTNAKLYLHSPEIIQNINVFVIFLVDAYFEIKKTVKTYFLNLMAIREIVCYRMKISEKMFAQFMDEVYKLNLQEELQIKISLEVDKLPEETKAMYLTREPVMVAGRYRNIIAIDISKEHNHG